MRRSFTQRWLLVLQSFLCLACILWALNICCTHSLPLLVQAAPSLAWHNSNLRTNGALGIGPAWPPNLQHIDIWSAIELPTTAAEQTSAEEPEMRSLQAIEGFQYADSDADASYEGTSGGLNGTQVEQKIAGKQKHGKHEEAAISGSKIWNL